MDYILPGLAAVVALGSVILSPRAESEGAFYQGLSASGHQPGLLSLTFSQVTTWIFARSLMNAAILGFYYGIWGTLAYACYYLSFLAGGKIVDSLRYDGSQQLVNGVGQNLGAPAEPARLDGEWMPLETMMSEMLARVDLHFEPQGQAIF